MDLQLSEEQAAIVAAAQRFTEIEITPHAAQWDEEEIFPRATLEKAAELGFGAMYVSPEAGGIGLSRVDAALVIEAMAYGCPSTSAFISIHNMVLGMIDGFGADEVKARLLPKLLTMEEIASYCLTEPGSGSDAASLRTSAVRDGDHYVVNGTKAFISGAGASDWYICMLRTGGEGAGGVSCLAIPKDTPGLSFGQSERKMGWHSQPTAMVHFDSCKVPVANLIGSEGQGFKIAMSGLDGGRINIGACSLGGAQRCFDEAVSYVKERRQFGQAIAQFQNTQFMLAEMQAKLAAARALLMQAADKVERKTADCTEFAAMAKMTATESGSKIANDALQLHGGYGYLMDYPLERFVRDLRVHEILEGTSQIMRLVVGRKIVRD